MSISDKDLKNIYGVEALPSIFKNATSDNLDTRICLLMNVENPSWLASLLLLAFVAIALLGTFLVTWALKPMHRSVFLDDRYVGDIRVSRLFGADVINGDTKLGRAKLSFGGKIKIRGVKPYEMIPRGLASWDCRRSDDDTLLKLDLRSVSARSRTSKEGGF